MVICHINSQKGIQMTINITLENTEGAIKLETQWANHIFVIHRSLNCHMHLQRTERIHHLYIFYQSRT